MSVTAETVLDVVREHIRELYPGVYVNKLPGSLLFYSSMPSYTENKVLLWVKTAGIIQLSLYLKSMQQYSKTINIQEPGSLELIEEAVQQIYDLQFPE